PAPRRAGHRGGADRLHPLAPGPLQVPDVRRAAPEPAAHGHREAPEVQAARALLGGPDAPRELTAIDRRPAPPFDRRGAPLLRSRTGRGAMLRGRGSHVVLGALVLAGCATLTGELTDTSAGRVTALQGEAIVRRAPSGEVQSLGMDSRVFTGDVVQTRASSRCRITLHDATVLTLGEGSELEVQEVTFSPRDRTPSMVV